MRSLFRTYFVVLFAFVFAMPVFAQTDAQIEKELVSALKDIQTNSSYGGNYDEEKIKAAQAAFEGKLLKHTKSASTLNYKFGELGEHMPIATSEDGRFRIYSWDLMDGGTMRHFARLYQYQSPDGKVYSKTEKLPEQGMGPGFITDIFTLDTKDGKVYLAASTFIASGKLQSQSADLFRIDGGALNDKVNLIKTKSGLTNSVRFEYDNFSVIDRKDRPAKLITFDQKTNTLKIPVVIKDKEYPDGRVTDKFISYKFDGKYFVKSN